MKQGKSGPRYGFTTGACAAAAAKAAAALLLGSREEGWKITAGMEWKKREVEIPFPDGSRVRFRVKDSGFRGGSAWAAVVKEASDDPDVTNRAVIIAQVSWLKNSEQEPSLVYGQGEAREIPVIIKGGEGVGKVTKPGLPLCVGEAAINPVPRKMIRAAVWEILDNRKAGIPRPGEVVEVVISVPGGRELAKKTLNSRLGIIGGLSILGTTGIVKPLSSQAWTATIRSSMDVAKAMGHETVVLSVGRSSEKAHLEKFRFGEESYIMIGDYLEFSLREARKHQFHSIHFCAQWAKMTKSAMRRPQTHVRHGALSARGVLEFLTDLGYGARLTGQEFNTAREIFDFIRLSWDNKEVKKKEALPPAGTGGQGSLGGEELFVNVCRAAKSYGETITKGIPVTVHLVSYEKEIIVSSE